MCALTLCQDAKMRISRQPESIFSVFFREDEQLYQHGHAESRV